MSHIQVEDIQAHQISGIVDVRTPDEFARESIPGSRNIPLSRLNQASTLLPIDTSIILNCRTGRRAMEAYQILSQQGFNNLSILNGGLEAWKKAGHSVATQGHRFSIMQQVQMVAGTLILVGSLYQPLWFLAPLVGLGLLTAGLTNTCMMASLLSRMPWNQLPSSTTNNCSI